jgi:hypothetical protein
VEGYLIVFDTNGRIIWTHMVLCVFVARPLFSHLTLTILADMIKYLLVRSPLLTRSYFFTDQTIYSGASDLTRTAFLLRNTKTYMSDSAHGF